MVLVSTARAVTRVPRAIRIHPLALKNPHRAQLLAKVAASAFVLRRKPRLAVTPAIIAEVYELRLAENGFRLPAEVKRHTDNLRAAFAAVHRLDPAGPREAASRYKYGSPSDSVTLAAVHDHNDIGVITCRPEALPQGDLECQGVSVMTASQMLRLIGEEDRAFGRAGSDATLGRAMLSHMRAAGVAAADYPLVLRAAELEDYLEQYIP
jgi:hypothetical protein